MGNDGALILTGLLAFYAGLILGGIQAAGKRVDQRNSETVRRFREHEGDDTKVGLDD